MLYRKPPQNKFLATYLSMRILMLLIIFRFCINYFINNYRLLSMNRGVVYAPVGAIYLENGPRIIYIYIFLNLCRYSLKHFVLFY